MASQQGPESPGETGADPRIGRQFGKYRIRRHIGSGGMGVVYEAEDTLLKRRVAMKFLPEELASQPEIVERFLREAQVLARVQHPNVTAVYEIGKDESSVYMTMELLIPGSAGSYLRSTGPFAWADATRILADCCAALGAAHEFGLVHRDVKPLNILFCPRTGCAKLVDFGLVKDLRSEEQQLTHSGALLGTPLYMSPEQATNKPVDGRSDLYSLGATYYALLTSKPPFAGDSMAQILVQHCLESIPDPRRAVPEIPESCVRILARATEKSPAARYQSAKEMLADVEQVLAGQPRRDFRELLQPVPSEPLDDSPQSLGTAATIFHQTPTPTPTPPVNRTPNPALLPLETQSVVPLPTRRSALGTVVALGGVAALGGLGWLLAHRQPAGSPSVAPSLPVPVATPKSPQLAAGDAEAMVRIGVLLSLSGNSAQRQRPIRDAILLAVSELNAQGGLLGHQIDAVERDADGNDAQPNSYRATAERLISQDKVVTLIGTYTPASRKAVKQIVEAKDHLLIFPNHHEGLEESPNIIYTGAVPSQAVMPAIRYLVTTLGHKRLFLVGSDVYSARIINWIIRDQCQALGAQVVGEHYPLVRELVFESIAKHILSLKPDLIVNDLVGDSNVALFRALRKSGITSAKVPTLSLNISENELPELAELEMSGDYLASTYLQAADRPENRAFLKSFRQRHGEAAQVSDAMEAAYVGVKLWAAAAAAAQSLEPRRIRSALRNLSYEGPGGTVRIDPSNNHAWKMFRLGQVAGPGRVELVTSSEQPLEPIPYPGPRTRLEWDALSKRLLEEWGGSWANPKRPELPKASGLR